MHAECAVPPIENSYTIKFLHCTDDRLLVSLVATVNHNTAAKNWATHVETVKGTNVAAGLTNSCAQPTKGAWDVVELTVKCD
jgi:hypothetical protein